MGGRPGGAQQHWADPPLHCSSRPEATKQGRGCLGARAWSTPRPCVCPPACLSPTGSRNGKSAFQVLEVASWSESADPVGTSEVGPSRPLWALKTPTELLTVRTTEFQSSLRADTQNAATWAAGLRLLIRKGLCPKYNLMETITFLAAVTAKATVMPEVFQARFPFFFF